MNKFAAFQSVKVVGADYERTGQVGVYVGPGDQPGESAVKFEAEPVDGKPADPLAPQVTDTFPDDALEGV
jgi:hypothetical protein